MLLEIIARMLPCGAGVPSTVNEIRGPIVQKLDYFTRGVLKFPQRLPLNRIGPPLALVTIANYTSEIQKNRCIFTAMRIIVLTLLFLACAAFGQDCTKGQYLIDGKCVTSTCAKGEYLARNGQCLHDQTGESHPAGDGCNTTTCMDPACRWGNTTLMACSHPDDPADLAPVYVPAIEKWKIGDGNITGSSAIISSGSLSAPKPPPTYCGKHMIGVMIYRDGALYECVGKSTWKRAKKSVDKKSRQ